MTYHDFKRSLDQAGAPEVRPTLLALWHDAAGDWNAAHEAIQDDESADAAWVHAYLHRKEGDAANARYWYARAGRPVPDVPLDAEWEQIAAALTDVP